jgi:Outer membrane protein beta-barrel domain
MKKIILITLLLLSISSYSQTDSLNKKYRHELGADITGLLSQFFYTNNSNYYSKIPLYFVTYRYHLKKSNLRFGIGGTYNKQSINGYKINGEDKVFYNSQTNFSVRLGYEFVSELSKKWQAFYGIDFRPTIINADNQAQYSNGGYINGYKSKSTVYGFAPLLGFRFRINDRVSITTEASFSYNIEKKLSQKTYISLDNNVYPYIPNDKELKNTNIEASFSQPLFLILTVKL